MSVEWFFKLKEIDSLSKMRISHLSALSEQEDRLSKLFERRQERLLQTTMLKQAHSSLQQNLFDLEQKLKTASEQKQHLLDRGGDENKIKAYAHDIEKLEEDGFVLFESIENNSTELKDTKTFLEGLEKTILEIQSEVDADILEKKHEIQNLELRLKLLEEELPSQFQQTLKRAQSKKLAHGPFTRVDSGSCYFCRHKLSKNDEIEIDLQQQLKICVQCDRIFLPYGS